MPTMSSSGLCSCIYRIYDKALLGDRPRRGLPIRESSKTCTTYSGQATNPHQMRTENEYYGMRSPING